MTQRFTTARVQVRHLTAAPLLIDMITMVAVGMLTMFVLLLASFQIFDALHFESGLRYETRDDVADRPARGDGVSVTVTQGVQLMSAARFDDPEREPGDFTDAVEPTVWSHGDTSPPRWSALLAGVMVTGSPQAGRVLIDEATAVALDVTPGESVVLTTWDGERCRLSVSGVTRTFREIGGSVHGGLLIAPVDACADGVVTWSEEPARFLHFDAASPSPAAQTWFERMRDVLVSATSVQVSGLLPAILVIGLGLWALVSLRAVRRVRTVLAVPGDVLMDLGSRAARVRATPLAIGSALVTVAAFIAAWAAGAALWRVAGFFTQRAHGVAVACLFAAATVLVLVLAEGRARRADARRPVASKIGRTPSAAPIPPSPQKEDT